jgi:lipid-A-disaccharide synthase
MLSGRTDAIVRWCDLALVVSGTVTLQIAKQCRPMVIVYKSGLFDRALYTIARDVLFTTDYFTLPNLIAGREIVPELVPHFGDAEPVVRHASDLLESDDLASSQRSELRRVVEQFAGKDASAKAAELIAHAVDEACANPPAVAPLTR